MRKTQIGVSLDIELLDIIDRVAEENRRSRSGFIALILEKWSLELEDA